MAGRGSARHGACSRSCTPASSIPCRDATRWTASRAPGRPLRRAEHRHREWRAHWRRRHEPDRADLGGRSRRHQQRARPVHDVDRRGRELDRAESGGERGGPRRTTRRPRSRPMARTSTWSTTRSSRLTRKTPHPRPLVGVVKHADVAADGGVGSFGGTERGAPGTPRRQRERPDGRVPRRLRLRGRDQRLRRGRVERHAQGGTIARRSMRGGSRSRMEPPFRNRRR